MALLRFSPEDLVQFLKQQKIATMPELKAALGTQVDVTVFRKLKQIGYLSSYSHRGRYYTLSETAHFDEQGLWSFWGVHFSRYGTLRGTVEAWVKESSLTYTRCGQKRAVLATKQKLAPSVDAVARPIYGLYGPRVQDAFQHRTDLVFLSDRG